MTSRWPTVQLDSRTLDAPRAGVVATRMAELMGLYARPVGILVDRDVIDAVVRAAASAGIAEEVEAREPGDPARAHALIRALVASPVPTGEIPGLVAVLGYPRLAGLTGTSEASLRRYADGERDAPDDVAARLHFLVQVFALLRGSFNEFGIRRWLERPRSALDSRTPADVLSAGWDPEDEAPQEVLGLAVSLLS